MNSTETILLFEPEKDFALIIRKILENHDYNVVEFDIDKPETFNTLQIKIPDLVIVNVGYASGTSNIINKVQAFFDYNKFPILTTSNHDDLRKQALYSGAHDFVLKPFEFDRLVIKVDKLITTNTGKKKRDFYDNAVQCQGSSALIVDDSISARNRIRTILEKYKFTITGEAANGIEGLKKIKENKPDIITLDLWMPEMDGVTMLRILQKTDPEQKVIIISSLMTKKFLLETIKIGAFHFMAKPFNNDVLIYSIKRALAKGLKL